MGAFRKGDGRSRARSWTVGIAERSVAFAQKLGLQADYQCSAWGTAYLYVSNNRDENGGEITIRIGNHVSNGAGDRYGHETPTLSVHNETDEARLAALPTIKAAIKKLG